MAASISCHEGFSTTSCCQLGIIGCRSPNWPGYSACNTRKTNRASLLGRVAPQTDPPGIATRTHSILLRRRSAFALVRIAERADRRPLCAWVVHEGAVAQVPWPPPVYKRKWEKRWRGRRRGEGGEFPGGRGLLMMLPIAKRSAMPMTITGMRVRAFALHQRTGDEPQLSRRSRVLVRR